MKSDEPDVTMMPTGTELVFCTVRLVFMFVDMSRVELTTIADTPEPPGSWIPFKIKILSDEMPLMIVMQVNMQAIAAPHAADHYSRLSSPFAYLTPMIVPMMLNELVSRMPNMFDQAFSIRVVSRPMNIVNT